MGRRWLRKNEDDDGWGRERVIKSGGEREGEDGLEREGYNGDNKRERCM